MTCPKCGANLIDGAQLCYRCGAPQDTVGPATPAAPVRTKYCQHCGSLIDEQCVVCPKCGVQVAQLKAEQPTIVINNSNTNTNTNINRNGYGGYGGRPRNKWVALILCIFLGLMGAHKFYENKIGMGILYLFTAGLFCIGWVIDIIAILAKPTIYYV
ncbi:TM2 domain-containing protein [Acutalibacter muris]|uniref:TM2 domain-containing protein n=1 Tax=Acutalibacter muris TaxID=1796620 RepID=UPI00272DE40C|nr:TM2 domain-containing protein [Acutalibacter muris]